MNNLKNLNSKDLVSVRKVWRDQLLNNKNVTARQKKIFPELEKFDAYFYQKIEERFGKGKNIYNMPQEQVFQLFNELSNSDLVVKTMINNIENTGGVSERVNLLGIQTALAAGGNCEYVASWSTWVSAAYRYTPYSAKPYKADRVK